MIAKKIHYCWFGRNPKSLLFKKCIASWLKYCPDYEIVEWNEDNYDLSSAPLYVRQAYTAKRWAFVTDYVRLDVVYNYGGIYLDTDVELLKSPEALLGYQAYFGFENYVHINTGLGFGAEKGARVLKDMMIDYETVPFIGPNGECNAITCPIRNTATLQAYGLTQNNTKQVLEGNILILPSEYLCPISYRTSRKRITKNTISIHHFEASWQSELSKEQHKLEARKNRKKEIIREIQLFPRKLLRIIVGECGYRTLKGIFGRNGVE